MRLLSFLYGLLIVHVAVLLTSCDNSEDHDLSPVALIIEPPQVDTVNISSGDKQLYDMKYYVNTGGRVSRLQVKSEDSEAGERILLDTTYTEAVDEAVYVYVAPEIHKEKLEVKLRFKLWETGGKSTEQKRIVVVKNERVAMQEVGPIVLYYMDRKDDALMFNAPTQTFEHTPIVNPTDNTQSLCADLYLDTLHVEGNTAAFSSIFRSASNAYFVRNNSFDYAVATPLIIQTLYANSKRAQTVMDVNVNDIIIVGHDAKAEGVLFVQNVITDGDESNRCVQIRFKQIKSLDVVSPVVNTTPSESD